MKVSHCSLFLFSVPFVHVTQARTVTGIVCSLLGSSWDTLWIHQPSIGRISVSTTNPVHCVGSVMVEGWSGIANEPLVLKQYSTDTWLTVGWYIDHVSAKSCLILGQRSNRVSVNVHECLVVSSVMADITYSRQSACHALFEGLILVVLNMFTTDNWQFPEHWYTGRSPDHAMQFYKKHTFLIKNGDSKTSPNNWTVS